MCFYIEPNVIFGECFPEHRQPLIDHFNTLLCNATRARRALDPPNDHPGAFKHFQVLGDGRLCHGKGFYQFPDGPLAGGETRQNRSACRIGQCGERNVDAYHSPPVI